MTDLKKKLTSLYELQLIDSDLIESLRELRRIEKDEAPVQKKHRELNARIVKLDDELKPIQQEIAEIADSAKKLVEEKKETEDKLFGAATGEHKILVSLQQKREQIVTQIKGCDDKILKKQTDMDTIGIRKHELEQQVAEIQEEFDRVTKEREARKIECEKNVEQQKKKRQKFKDFEDRSLLNLYQRLQKQNSGLAIATIIEDVCTSCNVEVSTMTVQKLSYGDDIVYCPSCGCILFDNAGN